MNVLIIKISDQRSAEVGRMGDRNSQRKRRPWHLVKQKSERVETDERDGHLARLQGHGDNKEQQEIDFALREKQAKRIPRA